MRGEHLPRKLATFAGRGSSPHARGALRTRASRLCRHGIIPACAGSTLNRQALAFTNTDHPRMRGEHTVDVTDNSDVAGSSPHARGALCQVERR